MDRTAEVVVVGAGPSGLACAIELGRRGRSVLVLERADRSGRSPRAKTTHTRTREHLRRWGIADDLAAASPLGIDYPANVLFVTSLAGQLIARFEGVLNCSPRRDDRYSEHSQWIPQYKLESVLLAHARTLPSVRIEFGEGLVDLDQDSEGVVARSTVATTGVEQRTACRFLVGADGAGSTVRGLIGATMIGTHGLSNNYNVIFRAPGLADAHSHGPGIMYWQLNSEAPSLVGPMDVPDVWYFMPTGMPADATFTDEEMAALLRRATGLDLEVEVLSSDSWTASRLLADHYSAGNVFLVGDACHLHPPFGGFGMNMGVSDGVDLAWKIAATLQGWGGHTLLASYESERRGAHQHAMDEAEANHALNPSGLYRTGMEDDTPDGAAARATAASVIEESKRAEFYALGVVLGFSCVGSPVIVDDGTGADWRPARDYVPSATPGCLAPHRWLADGRSLYDLFGDDLTLLVLAPGHDDDVRRATDDAAATSTPLAVVDLADEALATLYGAELALIRPDQVVAFRGDRWPGAGLLDVVCGRPLD